MEVTDEFLDLLPDELLMNILLFMDSETLLKFCANINRVRGLCNDEYFWGLKYLNDFPDEMMPPVEMFSNYKNLYKIRATTSQHNVWTMDKATNATKNHIFIDAKTGKTKLPVNILKNLETNPDTLYHTGYRITGTPGEIVVALREAGFYDELINDILSSAISSKNYNMDPFATLIQQEITAFRERDIPDALGNLNHSILANLRDFHNNVRKLSVKIDRRPDLVSLEDIQIVQSNLNSFLNQIRIMKAAFAQLPQTPRLINRQQKMENYERELPELVGQLLYKYDQM